MEGGLACLFRKSPDTELLKLVMEGTDLKTIQENNVLPELRDDDDLSTKKAAIVRFIRKSAIFPNDEHKKLETKINNLAEILYLIHTCAHVCVCMHSCSHFP